MTTAIPYGPGPLPVMFGIADDIGMVETINDLLDWDPAQCTVSPGHRLLAIAANFLTEGAALVHLEEFYAQTDTETLFGEGIEPSHLNDDALARGLEKFVEAGCRRVTESVLLEAATREGIDTGILHGDTTSFSVHGEFDSEDYTDDTAVTLTYGHSKDNRPDLKQFNIGLGVNRDGVPVVGDILDGNRSDMSWNTELVGRLRNTLETDEPLVYVGDSKVVREETFEAAADQEIDLLTRLPKTFNLTDAVIEDAIDTDDWIDVGTLSDREDATHYRVQRRPGTLYDQAVSCVVVQSSSKAATADERVSATVASAEASLESALEAVEDRTFACEPDAQSALETWREEHADPCFDVTAAIIETERKKSRDGPGRPPKDWDPYETVYTIEGSIERNEAAISRRKAIESCFVVVTTIQDTEAWPATRVLEEYKHQDTVERRFPLLKDPKLVGPIYAKRDEQVEALGYVLILALLIYSVIERRARASLADAEEPMEIVGAQPTDRPTGHRVLERFQNVMVLDVDGDRVVPDNVELPDRVLGLIGLDRSIYGVQSD